MRHKAPTAPVQRLDDLREELLESRPSFRKEWETSSARRSIALALVRLRTEAGRSQTDVAKHAGWDKAFVSRLEAASGPLPDTATLTRYAAACGRALGLVFANVTDEHAHVIDAVTLSAPIEAHPFERLRGEDLVLQDTGDVKVES
jgi:transcriptional regulator with XRE-family HTH domain